MFEEAVDASGEVALEAAACFASGLVLVEASFDVGLGGGVVAGAGEDRGVEGAVELAVAAAVEAVADGLAGGGGDGGGAGEVGVGGLASAAAGVGPGAVEDRGGDGADAGLGEELGAVVLGESREVLVVGADLSVEVTDAGGLGTMGTNRGGTGWQMPGPGEIARTSRLAPETTKPLVVQRFRLLTRGFDVGTPNGI